MVELALRPQRATFGHTQSRPRLALVGRAFWVALLRLWSRWRSALVIVRPETVIRWHRNGIRLYWRSLSKRGPRRPRNLSRGGGTHPPYGDEESVASPKHSSRAAEGTIRSSQTRSPICPNAADGEHRSLCDSRPNDGRNEIGTLSSALACLRFVSGEANRERIRTAEIANRGHCRPRRDSGPISAVSASDTNGLDHQDPADSRRFLGLHPIARGGSPATQTKWRRELDSTPRYVALPTLSGRLASADSALAKSPESHLNDRDRPRGPRSPARARLRVRSERPRRRTGPARAPDGGIGSRRSNAG